MVARDPGSRWAVLKRQHPVWYGVLSFFHPAALRSTAANFLTVFLAIFSLFVIWTLETNFKFFYWCVCLFCWGRIISYVILVVLNWKG
jgi:hypothetical protein